MIGSHPILDELVGTPNIESSIFFSCQISLSLLGSELSGILRIVVAVRGSKVA